MVTPVGTGIHSMRIFSTSGKVVTRAIIIQVAIAAGIVLWFKVGIPKLQQERGAEEESRREGRIQDFLQSVVAEDSAPDSKSPEGAQAHPRRLLKTPSIDDVKEELGPAEGFTSDAGGGVHIIWTGSRRKLEASFNQGRLYCLRVETLGTGHGELIFPSSAEWREF